MIIHNANSNIYEEVDINRIKDLIENFGLATLILQIDEHLNKFLERKRFKLIFNLVPALNDRYSRFVPAICELLKIPYVGTGIFTNSMLTGGFSKEILQYHGISYSENPIENSYYISVLGNKKEISFNIGRLDSNGKISKDVGINEETQKMLISNVIELKYSLKLYDYFSLSGVFKPKQKSKFIIQDITPSPALKESSPFCESFKSLGKSYEEIIAGILIGAMRRYDIALSEKLEALSNKIFG